MTEPVFNPDDPSTTNIRPEWLERMEQAQLETHETIGGKSYPRKPYGCEVDSPRPRCRDCAIAIGELHVFGCCVERCPACGAQNLGCDCYVAGEAL